MSERLEPGLLDAFAAALDGERRALLERDTDGLRQACAAKSVCLRRLSAIDAAQIAGGAVAERLRVLADLNRANGELIARRRRDVDWMLSRLGRATDAAAYDPRGMLGGNATGRDLALA